jgi:hypothetical protein
MCKDRNENNNELVENINVEDPMINSEAVDGTYYEFLNDIKTSTSADKDDFCSLFIYL